MSTFMNLLGFLYKQTLIKFRYGSFVMTMDNGVKDIY